MWTYVFKTVRTLRSLIAVLYGKIMFNLVRNCLPKWLLHFEFPPAMKEYSCFSTPLQQFIASGFQIVAILRAMQRHFTVELVLISLMTCAIEHPFMCLFAICEIFCSVFNWAVLFFLLALKMCLWAFPCSFSVLITECGDASQARHLYFNTGIGSSPLQPPSCTWAQRHLLGFQRACDLPSCQSFTCCGFAELEKNRILLLWPESVICGQKFLLTI